MDVNSPLKAERLKDPFDPVAVGMEASKLDQGAASIRQEQGRMLLRLPFDQRGRDALIGQTAVGGDGDQPPQIVTAHSLDLSERPLT